EPFVYLMTEGEEPVGAIFQSDEAGSGPIVYLATDDIDATIAKVRDAGRRERRDVRKVPRRGRLRLRDAADPPDRLVRPLQGHRRQRVLALPGRPERARRPRLEQTSRIEQGELGRRSPEDRPCHELAAEEAEHVAVAGVATGDPCSVAVGH